MKRIGLIANPNSGRKQGRQRAVELKEIMEPKGVDVWIHYTQPEEAMTATIAEMAPEVDLIVVMGGDGTVNQVVNGIMAMDETPPLAIYPMGTVNDFATYLGIPKKIQEFAVMIQEGVERQVDVGKVGQRCFLNVAAGGLLPELAHRVSSEAKTVLGKFAYYMEGIKEFPKQFFHPIPIELEVDGIRYEKEILFFLAANSPFVGGFRNLVPKAKVDDGLLELLVVESGELPDMANVLFNFIRRQIVPDLEPVKGITYYRVSSFRMTSPEAVDVDVDGEFGGRLPMTFTLLPKALKLIVPTE